MLRLLDPLSPFVVCPFCGGARVALEVDAGVRDSYRVVCLLCNGAAASSEAQALERWSERRGESAATSEIRLQNVELLAEANRLQYERDQAISARDASAAIAHSLTKQQAA